MERTRETRTIAGHKVELEKLPPRANFCLLAKLIRTIGAPASAGLADPEKLKAVMGADLDWKTAGLWFVTNALPGLDELKPDEVLDIADELLVGKLILDGAPVETGPQLDAMLDDVYVYIRLIRFGIELNFRPTSAGSATAAGSSPPAKNDAAPPATSGP